MFAEIGYCSKELLELVEHVRVVVLVLISDFLHSAYSVYVDVVSRILYRSGNPCLYAVRGLLDL